MFKGKGEKLLSIYLSVLENEEQKIQFEEIYINYKKLMYSVAYGILHNPHDAEDAVHQAFLSIANNFKKISSIPCQELKPYLVIIVRNTSINLYNKNKRHADRTAELSDELSFVEVDFFEGFAYDELLNTISKLPEKYRDVLYLHYINGFSTKEISQMIGISVDTIWKRIERAKKQFKELLEGGENNAK